jgi:hypothetical protein
LNDTVPAAADGDIVAVNIKLAPGSALVMLVLGADAKAAVSVFVARTAVTAKAVAVEVVVEKSAGTVGLKVAFRELLLATGSVVVVQVAVPELTAMAPHPLIVVGVVPYVKATVPLPEAPAPLTVAVSVTSVP